MVVKREPYGLLPMLPQLEAALRHRICYMCVDLKADGSCDVDERRDCPLFNNLPQLARVIAQVDGGTIEDYIAAIRRDLCETCLDQRLDGSCSKRDEVRCALDRYLVPVVETIEEVMRIKAENSGGQVH